MAIKNLNTTADEDDIMRLRDHSLSEFNPAAR